MILVLQVWQDGKFSDFLKGSTYDPALGYPVSSNRHPMSFIQTPYLIMELSLTRPTTRLTVEATKICTAMRRYWEPCLGGLGGGDEFGIGDED